MNLHAKGHIGGCSRFEVVKADQLAKRELFEDEEFPANMDSLGERLQVEWKRPHVRVDNGAFNF